MVWLPGGRFTMGGRASTTDFNEHPQHAVAVQPFAISTHEITIAEYAKFAKSTNRKIPKTGDLNAATMPIFFVSWNDTLAYTKWLSTQSGKTYRIPTEAEWEYAVRGGTTTVYWWGRQLGRDNGHCFACETGLDRRQPTKIGRFDPNPFGIYDLTGNVEEWVYDCYNKNYEGAPSDGSVFEGGDCSVRITRGGAYSSGPKALRSSARSKFRFDTGNDSIGIRVVRDP
jgi:formylglycine-generating enzyme required for sulfatase activity